MKTTSSRFNYKSYVLFVSSLNYHSNVDSYPSEPNKTGQRNCWAKCLPKYVVTSRFRQVVTQVDPQRQRKHVRTGVCHCYYLRVSSCSSTQQHPTKRWIDDRGVNLEKMIEMATHTQEVAEHNKLPTGVY